MQSVGREAVLSIPSGVIEPFLSQPLIVEENELNTALRIVATQEGRVNIAHGDKAYGLGDLDGRTPAVLPVAQRKSPARALRPQ